MKNNRDIKYNIEKALGTFYDNFVDIEKSSSTELSLSNIEQEYLENNKSGDSAPITKHYKDFDFLNSLSLLDKNKYITLYSLLIYFKNIFIFHKLGIEDEYFYYIKFHIEGDFLNDESITLMSDLHYQFYSHGKNITKTQLIGNYTTEIDNIYMNFFQDIINELGVKDLVNIYFCENDYGYGKELSIVIDFPLSNKQNLISNIA